MDDLVRIINQWATAFGVWIKEEIFRPLRQWEHRWDVWWDGIQPSWETKVLRLKEKRRLEGSEIDPEIQEELDEIVVDHPRLRGIMLLFLGIRLTTAKLGVWLQGLAARQARKVNADLRPSMLGYDVLVRYLLLNPHRQMEVKVLLDQLGIDDTQQNLLIQSVRQVPTLAELIPLLNRGEVSENYVLNTLEQMGLSASDADEVVKLRNFFPGPQDMIMLLGREAFEEGVISRFKLDQDLDKIDRRQYRKAGLTDEVARWYWVAHWRNPSIQQAFEMLHRLRPGKVDDPFTEEDLESFYRLDDISPFFGEKLKQIAYRPYTRVDTRRMYEMGVLDREGVKDSYLDQGYDEEHAETLAQFAERAKEFTERDLTRTQIEKLFEYGLIDYTQFVTYLQALGYDEGEAYHLADLKLATLEEDRLKSYITRAEWEYKRGLLDRAGAIIFLSRQEMKTGRIQELLEQWDNQRITEQTIPSKEDLIGWLATGKIETAAFRTAMQKKFYGEEDIELYIQDLGQIPSKTDAVRFFNQELIKLNEFRTMLTNLGYSQEDINVFVRAGLNVQRNRRKARELQEGS